MSSVRNYIGLEYELEVFFRYGKRVRKSEMSQDILLLGKRIREIIKEKGLKTTEVAHDAKMDVENPRKYINGKQEIKISTMINISKSLNITVNNLFDFLDNK